MGRGTGAGKGAVGQGRRRGSVNGGGVNLEVGRQMRVLDGGDCLGGWRDAAAWLSERDPGTGLRGDATGGVKGNSN